MITGTINSVIPGTQYLIQVPPGISGKRERIKYRVPISITHDYELQRLLGLLNAFCVDFRSNAV